MREKKITKAKKEIIDIIKNNQGIITTSFYSILGEKYTRSHIYYFLRSLEKEKKVIMLEKYGFLFCYLPGHSHEVPEERLNRTNLFSNI